MKFTQIPSDTFAQIQLNAGVLVRDFDPTTGEIDGLVGATSGGVSASLTPTFTDYGDDIDNCPKNMMELKKLDNHEVTMSGTFVTLDAATAKLLAGSADVDALDESHIIPRNDILTSDFADIWWIGDYSDENTGDNAGFVAIHILNALNTGGFQIQTTDKEKGKFAFEFMGHYSMEAQDTVPYEIYIKQGGSAVVPAVLLNKHAISLVEGDTFQLTAQTIPAGETVTYSSSATAKADVTSGGLVSGESEGTAIITATITVDGVNYTDTCTVVVEEAPVP